MAWAIWPDKGRRHKLLGLKPLYYSSTLNNSGGIEFWWAKPFTYGFRKTRVKGTRTIFYHSII